MEWLLWIAVGIFAYFAVSRLTAPAKGIRTMSADELKGALGKKGSQYIDVRTPAEYKAHHIKGFKNIPLSELPKRASELAKDKETLIICQSGMRSSRASRLLKKNGFANVVNIRGGMSSYRG